MRKLRLDLSALRVESYDLQHPGYHASGSVVAAQQTAIMRTCAGDPTCSQTSVDCGTSLESMSYCPTASLCDTDLPGSQWCPEEDPGE